MALIDLDETLINKKYQLTIPEKTFKKIAGKLERQNIVMGLCSDSSVTSLKQWSDRLGISGPLIAECGAVVWEPFFKKTAIISPRETNWFLDFRSLFIDKIIRNFDDTTLMVGDATEFIRKQEKLPAVFKNLVIINKNRTASFSVYAKKFSKNSKKVENAPELLKEISSISEKLLKSFGKEKKDLFWDENPNYGILIIHSKKTAKKNGINFTNQRFNPDKIFMIGNSMADYVGIPSVSQLAVKNALPEYKNECEFVATKNFTGGVVELLERIMEKFE